MTNAELLDHFAGRAMQAIVGKLIKNPLSLEHYLEAEAEGDRAQQVADMSYRFAWAMIEERPFWIAVDGKRPKREDSD